MIEQQNHPIERIMDNALAKMRSLVDVDTIVGEPIMTADGVSIIPVSKITMGFLSGGSEFKDNDKEKLFDYPFAGANGAGVSISPVCFLVNDGKTIKLINISNKSPFDKIIDSVPELASKLFSKKGKKT